CVPPVTWGTVLGYCIPHRWGSTCIAASGFRNIVKSANMYGRVTPSAGKGKATAPNDLLESTLPTGLSVGTYAQRESIGDKLTSDPAATLDAPGGVVVLAQTLMATGYIDEPRKKGTKK